MERKRERCAFCSDLLWNIWHGRFCESKNRWRAPGHPRPSFDGVKELHHKTMIVLVDEKPGALICNGFIDGYRAPCPQDELFQRYGLLIPSFHARRHRDEGRMAKIPSALHDFFTVRVVTNPKIQLPVMRHDWTPGITGYCNVLNSRYYHRRVG